MNIEQSLIVLEKHRKELTVQTAAHRVKAIAFIKTVREKRAEVVAFFEESKGKAHATWKSIVAQEKTFTDKLDGLEIAAKTAIGVFDQAQERLRAAEEERLRKEAEAQTEANRRKLEGIAKRTKNEDKRDAILDKAAAVTPAFVSLPSAVKKEEGESSRKNWYYRITDIERLAREYLIPNDVVLKALARSPEARKTPPEGVEFYFETSLVVKS
jgi:hypothetical protein